MPVRKANKQEKELAEEVWNWLPKPMYVPNPDGNGSVEGPGVLKLRESGPLGARALSNIRKGYECKPGTFLKLKEVHTKLAQQQAPKLAPLQVQPAANYQDFRALELAINDATEGMNTIRALQNNHGRMLLDVKGMLEKLMKALGETP